MELIHSVFHRQREEICLEPFFFFFLLQSLYFMRHCVPIKRIQIECFAETAFAQGYNYSVSDCSTRALLNFLLIFKRSGGNATRDVLLTAHIPPTRACFLAMCDILFFQVAAQSCCNSSQTQKKTSPCQREASFDPFPLPTPRLGTAWHWPGWSR